MNRELRWTYREELLALTYNSMYNTICIWRKPNCQFYETRRMSGFGESSLATKCIKCYLCSYVEIFIKIGYFILVFNLQILLVDQPFQKQPAQYQGKFGVRESFLNISSIISQYNNK